MEFSVISYNIHKGFSFTSTRKVLHEMRDEIYSLAPDFIILQEVVGGHERHYLEDCYNNSQVDFLKNDFWRNSSYGKNAIYTKGHHGNAILSRHKFKQFYNTDLSLNRFEQRGLLCSSVCIDKDKDKGEVDLHILNTHLNLREKDRQVQCQKILEEVSKYSHESFILAGDFNDIYCKVASTLKQSAGVKEAHFEIHNEYPRTFPCFLPILSLDRVFYKNLQVLEAKVLQGKPWSRLSDHLPLWCKFKI